MMFAMTEKIGIIGNKKLHAKTVRLATVFIVEMGKSTPPCRTLRSLRGKILISDNVYCLKSFSYEQSLSFLTQFLSLTIHGQQ